MIQAEQAHDLILVAGNPWLYRVAVLVAALVGSLLVRRDSASWPVTARIRNQVLGVVALGSLIGCALPVFLAGGTIGALAAPTWLAPKTILGGLLFGFFAVAIFKRVTHSRADTSDAFTRGAIAMMLIGRLGCIAQHCCYGDVTTLAWGMDFGDGLMRVPVQYVETAGLLALAAGVQWLHQTNRLRGRRLFALFASYGALRFGLEFLRAPIAEEFLGLGFYQWLALLLVAVGTFELFKRAPDSQSPSRAEAGSLALRTKS